MADMSAALRDRLKAAGIAGGNVYRDERPQGGRLPSVVLFVVSDPRPVTMDGDQRLRDTLVQIDVDADSRGDANSIADQVIAVACPAGVQSGVRFSRSFVDASRQTSDRPTGLTPIYRTSLDLRVWHQPAA